MGACEAAWLPPGAWTACLAEYTVEEGETVVVGIDLGGVREVVFDPCRFQSEPLRLEREHGLTVVQLPQSHARLTAT
jgi:hypothetical protein